MIMYGQLGGTTSVKVCLVDTQSKEVSHKFVKDTLAAMPKDVPQADLQVHTPKSWFNKQASSDHFCLINRVIH